MARKFGPFDTSQFYEVENRRMQRALAAAQTATGFIAGYAAGQGKVTAGTGSQLVIAAYPDGALVDGLYVENPTSETVPLWPNSSSSPRADRLVLRLDMNAKTIEPLHIQGTPSGNPQPPALARTATLYDLPLCRFTMPGSASAQNPASIVDERVSATEWMSFTPELTSTGGTQPLMNAANRTGRYRYIAPGLVTCEMAFKWVSLGFGEGLGSGDYRFGLPVPASSSYPAEAALGAASYADVGTAIYSATAMLAIGTTSAVHIVAGQRVGATLPVAPANGDSYTASITYEVA